MTIQDIECFFKLAETLNYTKAAEEMHISQPAVTRHINTLEDELGVRLFDRSVKRRVALTEAGNIYYAGLLQCRNIYNDTIKSITSKAMESPIIINLLRGTRFPDPYVLTTNRFMEEHPAFTHFIHFIEGSSLPGALENGEAVICPAEYAPLNSNHKTVFLKDVCHYLVAGREHPAFCDENKKSPDYQKLRESTLFLPQSLPETLAKRYLAHLCSLIGGEPKEIIYLDSIDSIEVFLRSGRCFTICDGWQSLLHSSSFISKELSLTSRYVAAWDVTKCIYPFTGEYFAWLKKSPS